MANGGKSVLIGTITDTSPATASTAAGDIISGLQHYHAITIDASLVGATGGTLDVYLQRKVESDWVDWVHFTQLAAGAAAVRYVMDTENTPDTGAAVTVGANTTPLLAAGEMAGSRPGDTIRALYVAGASTSAGAAVSIKLTGWQAPA